MNKTKLSIIGLMAALMLSACSMGSGPEIPEPIDIDSNSTQEIKENAKEEVLTYVIIDIKDGVAGGEFIKPGRFTVAENQVRKVCLLTKQNSKACMWIALTKDELMFSVVPNKNKLEVGDRTYQDSSPKSHRDTYTIDRSDINTGLKEEINTKALDKGVFMKAFIQNGEV